MKKQILSTQLSQLFRSLNQPTRVDILLAIGSGEACVCHLEGLLKMRQAYISQHLMSLREAGILEARREGRYIFYRLKNPQMLDFLLKAAEVAGYPIVESSLVANLRPHAGCCCPKCAPGSSSDLIDLHLSEVSY